MLSRRAVLLMSIMLFASHAPSVAQEGPEVMGNFLNMMQQIIATQQQQDALKNSPEYQDQQIQPGGLTRGQVVIVQQLLINRGYDIGPADGIIGPKTRAVVAQLQAQAGVAITGYPTPLLLDALLQPQ
jgi:peptidoglycan hydrolase-like protein with peptidoglycan-binding domain